jgi:hypothetical protein
MPISKYVRSIIVEHIVKEISPEKTINKIIWVITKKILKKNF